MVQIFQDPIRLATTIASNVVSDWNNMSNAVSDAINDWNNNDYENVGKEITTALIDLLGLSSVQLRLVQMILPHFNFTINKHDFP